MKTDELSVLVNLLNDKEAIDFILNTIQLIEQKCSHIIERQREAVKTLLPLVPKVNREKENLEVFMELFRDFWKELGTETSTYGRRIGCPIDLKSDQWIYIDFRYEQLIDSYNYSEPMVVGEHISITVVFREGKREKVIYRNIITDWSLKTPQSSWINPPEKVPFPA